MSYYGRRSGGWSGWQNRPKVNTKKYIKTHPNLKPVSVEGRAIASSFWGQKWCDHFEAMADFENRLPRGRTYCRNGSILHLEVSRGAAGAVVAGSDFYDVIMNVKPLPPARWEAIKRACQGSIGTIIDLLKGRLSSDVMKVICDPQTGMFPLRNEMSWKCSCPDWASLCKHVASVFYGIGHRLDQEPELIFTLRGVDPSELIAGTADSLLGLSGEGAEDVLAGDLSAIFGIEVEPEQTAPPESLAAVKEAQTGPAEAPKRGREGKEARALAAAEAVAAALANGAEAEPGVKTEEAEGAPSQKPKRAPKNKEARALAKEAKAKAAAEAVAAVLADKGAEAEPGAKAEEAEGAPSQKPKRAAKNKEGRKAKEARAMEAVKEALETKEKSLLQALEDDLEARKDAAVLDRILDWELNDFLMPVRPEKRPRMSREEKEREARVYLEYLENTLASVSRQAYLAETEGWEAEKPKARRRGRKARSAEEIRRPKEAEESFDNLGASSGRACPDRRSVQEPLFPWPKSLSDQELGPLPGGSALGAGRAENGHEAEGHEAEGHEAKIPNDGLPRPWLKPSLAASAPEPPKVSAPEPPKAPAPELKNQCPAGETPLGALFRPRPKAPKEPLETPPPSPLPAQAEPVPSLHFLSGRDIRYLRDRAGLSVSELAAILKVTAASVSRWESVEGIVGLNWRTAKSLRDWGEAVLSAKAPVGRA